MTKRMLYMFPLLALLLWMAAGCTGSEVEREEPAKPGSLLSVQIPAGVVPLQAAAPLDTRSSEGTEMCADTLGRAVSDSLSSSTRAGEVYARAIVLQYKGGTLQNAGNTDIDSYTVGNSISAKLVAGEGCNIYVLVVNETSTSGSNSVFQSEAGLKAATYDLYGKHATPTDNDIPLAGSLTGVNVVRMTVGGTEAGLIQQSSSQAAVEVELKRIAAKVHLNFWYGLAGYMADASSGQIMNVPKDMLWMESAEAVSPAESAGFVNVPFNLSDCDGDNSNSPATEFVRYIPANKRGSKSGISRPTDKYSANAPSKMCTYFTFTAKEKANTAHVLTYSFYLGANNTTDFNVDRNYIYTVNTSISQGAGGDNRVTETGLRPEVHTDPLVQSITSTGATLRGTFTGPSAPSEQGFYYKAGTSFEGGTGAEKVTSSNLSAGSFIASLTGLTAKSVYYFRSYVVFGGQTLYGELASFSTSADGMPVLTTLTAPASATDGKSATSAGNVISSATAWGIVYATTTGFKPAQGAGTRIQGSVATGGSLTITSLTPGSNYYYYHYASNPQGYIYSSSEGTFRTKDYPAVPTGLSVVSTVADKLTFKATLPERKNGVDDYPTTAGIKLWTSDPGTLTSSGTAATTLPFSAPSTPAAKSVDWTAMVAGQKYYYAAYSVNGVGTVYHGAAASSFTASAVLADPSPKTSTVGPQSANGAVTITTTGRNTNATVTSGTGPTIDSGTGTASKSINIAANASTADRVATITFTTLTGELPLRSATATITQYGVEFPASFGNVANVPKEGKTATNVAVLANIPWQATSNVSWCDITNGSQTGANTQAGSSINFAYTVEKNVGAARTATITVKGTGSFTSFSKTFTIDQLAGRQVDITPNDPNKDDSQVDFKSK